MDQSNDSRESSDSDDGLGNPSESKSTPPVWDARARMFEQYRLMEIPVPKPSWTFPSPFVPYAVAIEAREQVCWGPQPRTLAELRMYGLSWAIRSKPEWQRKSSDPTIVEKWRQEVLDQQEGLEVEQRLTPNMINYVLTELSGYARLSDPTNGIEYGPFDAIWYSDRLISSEVQDRLRGAVAQLEDVPEDLQDWHPGSNGQVLDLVHPSPYCIVYGRTCYSDLDVVKPPEYDPPKIKEWSWGPRPVPVSEQFCWLPSDFSVDPTDGSAKLISPYINNLHPTKYKAMYPVIESVLTSFIPLFERVLSQINGEDKDIFRDITPGSGRIKTELAHGTWAGYNSKYAGETVPCIWSKFDEVEWEEGMTDAEYENLRKEAPKVLPEAFEAYTGELEKTIAPYSLRGKTIQCIIKLANIHLTAEKPEYKGGSWHVEAMLNERIVASGIYYYEEENISESRIAFRVTTGSPTYHQQHDDMCMEILYGLKGNAPCVQELGSIATTSGRALAWPNVYQHCVAPFQLVDPTKPGHRKILAIFLVDPSIKPIPSATNIPPQQATWALDALVEARDDPNSLFSRLPLELLSLITENASETLMTQDEAEEYRLELMEERTGFVQDCKEDWTYKFNMCEH